jgi:periplasmic divalent cation tolerance protein
MENPIVVLCTTPNAESARSVALSLLQAKLVACVNILPGTTSLYWWEGKVEEATEHLLIIKTLSRAYPAVEKKIREHHPYETPEVLAVQTEQVSEPYRAWIVEIVRQTVL